MIWKKTILFVDTDDLMDTVQVLEEEVRVSQIDWIVIVVDNIEFP
jgi:hypothetical protein